jgi:uncharacterized protein (DUF58 family)
MTVTLTRDGWMTLLASATLLVWGIVAGSNPVLLLGAILASLMATTLWLAARNISDVSVSRQLPVELFAGRRVSGHLTIHNTTPRPRWQLALRELDEGDATTLIRRIPGCGFAEGRAQWTFDFRGRRQMDQIRLQSRWPFGLLSTSRVVSLPVEVLVYPAPRFRGTTEFVDDEPFGERPDLREGHEGDFLGLRPYRIGDARRSIHWRTSARAGEPMVVQRTTPRGGRRIVRVPLCSGDEWEQGLSRASGAILDGFSRGWRVGLELPEERLPVGEGPHWRRRLLDRLAEAPFRREGW